MAETAPPFNMQLVCASFTKCKRDDGTIGMDDYIEGYTEVMKFFELFGTVFSFVSSDVSSKLAILREHRSSNCSPHYITVQSMVDFEVDRGITNTKARLPSGSRTLLRLHRALEFITLFLRQIQNCPNDTRLNEVGSTAYQVTLSQYHPWIIQKAVGLALYTLPTREQLVARLHMSETSSLEMDLGQIVASIQPVYDTVQKLYADANILNLP